MSCSSFALALLVLLTDNIPCGQKTQEFVILRCHIYYRLTDAGVEEFLSITTSASSD